MQISSEPGLRGELLASGADKAPFISDSLAVWSEATRLMFSSLTPFLCVSKILILICAYLRNLRRGLLYSKRS